MQSCNRLRDPGHAETCGISDFRGFLDNVPAIFLSTRLPPENHTRSVKTLADGTAAGEDGGCVNETQRIEGKQRAMRNTSLRCYFAARLLLEPPPSRHAGSVNSTPRTLKPEKTNRRRKKRSSA